MALIIKKLIEGYHYVFNELSDPRVENYFLMKSPFPTLMILGAYLYFVLNWGPKWMKNRKPFNLDRILILYNFFQIVICSILVFMGFRYTFFTYNPFCEPVDFSYEFLPLLVARCTWYYFLLKVVDLLDTVFFVLRKKNKQITFLHVYHHTGMVILIWAGTKYIPGGHGVLIGFLNCIVHVFMYSYYLLTAWNPKYKNNVWWKKHLTQLQLLQFVMLFFHFAQILFQPSCTYPKWVAWVFIPQNLFMTIMFGDFYWKTYVKPRPIIRKGVNGFHAGIKHVVFVYSWVCEPVDYSNEAFPVFITWCAWTYYMIKVVDLLDTVFFILRKKDRQITFLHVYHHTGMVIASWIGTKYVGGGHSVMFGFINCFVHSVMYSYYLLSVYNSEYKKSLWWKKHLTQLQIVQFLILIIHFGVVLFQPTCSYPKFVSWLLIPQNVFMLFMFGDFYRKAYMKPKSSATSNEKVH